MNLYTKSLLLLAVVVAQAHGAIYDDVSQLPTHDYDYIIVGGGTGGNAVANRLTENPNVNVLVLEAGGNNQGVLGSIIPLLGPTLSPPSPYDWNYTTIPQPGFNGRSVAYPRGRILGGSSSIDVMVYTTGSRDDWDYISRVTEDPSWAWDAMGPYRDRNQGYVAPNDGHDDTNQYLPSAHSRNGTLCISLPGATRPTDSRVMAAINEPGLSSEFPFQRDMNAGDTIGVGWVQAAIGHGERCSSATTYVGPKYINRPNLHILLHAQATKLLEAADSDTKTPRFNGVEFGTGPSSQRWQVTAYKEVILSAGVFNTPQLLMLSGIGDSAELTNLGITTRVHLPSVGKNLTDHVQLANAWRVNNNETTQSFLNPAVLPQEIQQWNQTRQGPLSWGLLSQMAWMRHPENDPLIKTHGDPSTGPTSAHYQIVWSNGWGSAVPMPEGNWMTALSNLAAPTSRGTVKLNSSNPFDSPAIDHQGLTTDYDVKTVVAALKAARRFMSAEAWKGFVIEEWAPLAAAKTDEEIIQYIKNYATTEYHAVGTAAMSPRGALWGATDPDLKVKGTKGLRVIDASALPCVLTAHTQGPVYLLAELAAEKIKAEWH